MENLLFYPVLTREMLEAAGVITEKYDFKYVYKENTYELNSTGTNTIKLIDPLEIWTIEDEGLHLERIVRIAYPDLLKGPKGVACKDAELGLCIYWANKKLTQTGVILPKSDIKTSQGRICKFDYSFDPHTVSGDLELVLAMYIQRSATIIQEEEHNLINEAGVTVGDVDSIILDFRSSFMEFPIEEYSSAEEPLWWLELSQWDDPKVDLFTKENLCLYLNPYYVSCPVPSTTAGGNHIKNFDVLVEILSQVYFLIFKELEEEYDCLYATKFDVGLTNGSICSIMHDFVDYCQDHHELQWNSNSQLLKSIQINIRRRLQENMND